ncbi:hypothetical protein GOEFS_104_00060 [Gordonia effusa NBRC 100432]|uniref:Uncharacterized protein n=1 Tax=Gordonia effusa NBRC 100432 TaxID=1077974 RepID=H0R4I6_9ACTN|nr:hypothetical protein GOEFS_104_00060 [Gordonia effusa NBRC 100432]
MAAAEQALAIGVAWEAPEDLEWNVEGPLILFDSAARGNDLAEDDRLTVDIDSGEYCVRVAYLECGDNCMILVQLKRL